jgi:dienelactone hydrolase
LRIPGEARGLVVFAHGSGRTRFSLRNRLLAAQLDEEGLATLVMDLLTVPEQERHEHTHDLRFEVELLSERLVGVIDWIGAQPDLRGLRLGLFGANSGAAAALNAAAARPQEVAAVVSRGGRVDLAQSSSFQLARAPTLLIVGALDDALVRLNREAAARLACEHRLDLVAGASHLFEERGKLDIVAKLASGWFERHLRTAEPAQADKREPRGAPA